MRHIFRLVLSTAATVALLSSLSFAQENSATSAQDTYKAKCQMCHAADGSGNTPAGKKFGAKDLKSAEVQKHTDAELVSIISKGQNKMPAFKEKLKEDQITALVGYIRDMAKK